jgi:predicted permease
VSVCLIFLLVLNGFLVKKIWELNSEVQGYLQENQ